MGEMGYSEEDDFDYDEYVREEFGDGTARGHFAFFRSTFVRAVALLVLLGFLLALLLRW